MHTLLAVNESLFDRWQQIVPLVSPKDTWTLWAVILGGVAVSIYLEQTRKWAAKISGPVLCMIAAMAMTNLKIMPTGAPAYQVVDKYLVPMAIPLLLFRANIFRIIKETGSMFLAFHISVLGTILGAFVATLIFWDRVEQVPQVAGIMTGSYSGGAVNFFACKESFEISSEITNPLIVADSTIMAGMFVVLLLISSSKFFLRHFPHPHSAKADSEENTLLAAEYWSPKKIGLLDIAKVLAIAVTIATVSVKIAALLKAAIDQPLLQAVLGNPFVLITFFSVIVATAFHRPMEKVGGSEELGAYLLYIFFFVIGLPADLVTVIRNVPQLFAFCVVMAVVNLIVTLVLGKLCRLDLEELLVCVNATLGGPPSAAAMAIAKGWPELVLPALLVGIWGYVIGTFLGVLVANTVMYFF